MWLVFPVILALWPLSSGFMSCTDLLKSEDGCPATSYAFSATTSSESAARVSLDTSAGTNTNGYLYLSTDDFFVSTPAEFMSHEIVNMSSSDVEMAIKMLSDTNDPPHAKHANTASAFA